MPAVTIRNISNETHRALKEQAVQHGRSTEAEIRAILDESIASRLHGGLGSELAAIGREFGVTTEFDNLRDLSAIEAANFE